jgi:penicillin-binding protein 2
MLVVVAATVLLTGQLYRLTITQSAMWRAQADEQRRRELPSSAPRGAIYDAKGRALATSEPAFAAVLTNQDPKQVTGFMPQLALLLSNGDQAKAEELAAQVIRRVDENRTALYRPIPIARNLPQRVVAAFLERKQEFPGVVLVTESSRNYTYGALAGSLMGYVGAITEDELEDKDRYKGYQPDEIVGKTGLEYFYENVLRGTPGHSNVEVDTYGRRVGDAEETPPVPGHSLYLALDMDLQKVAEEALVKQMAWIKTKNDPHAKPIRGALVVQNVRTGAILAMASVPTYDPNTMVRGLTTAEWEQLQNTPGFSFFNYAIYPFSPGSTFKMATGFAGLEGGAVGPFEQIHCTAQYWRYGNPKNWKSWDDGWQDVGRALATSCNPYFWEVSYRLEIEKMHQYFDLLGFGRRTGIDLPSESPGLNPTKESYGDRWQPGEVLNVAIGQGDMQVTPLQLANYTAAIAMNGVRYQPYLVEQVKAADGTVVMRRNTQPMETIPAKDETWQRLRQGMWQAANTPEGTAYTPMKGFPVKVGAKTGSAETGKAWYDATTVAFAPYDNPEIAVSVIIEGGSTGSWATPVVRRVMAQYFGINDVMPKDAPTYQE